MPIDDNSNGNSTGNSATYVPYTPYAPHAVHVPGMRPFGLSALTRVPARKMDADGKWWSRVEELETIMPGDEVLARDVATGVVAYRKVLRVFEHSTPDLYSVVFNRSPQFAPLFGPQMSVTATGGQLFWVVGRGWTQARALRVGDELHNEQAAANPAPSCFHPAQPVVIKVASVERTVLAEDDEEGHRMYSLEVEGVATYCVEDESVWVHSGMVQGVPLVA